MGVRSLLPELEGERAPELRERLCRWYATHARDLPWRRTRDPYAVWISEAMLQQTRVETVIPYWQRFLERFPTVVDLARASEDDLLAAWSGLGYYRRARSLRQAAIAIVERFGGRFPRDPSDARTLPGVGPYTAGAVLSIAYDEPQALVDGNVLRVFARLFALSAPLDSRELSQRVWALAEALVPRRSDDAGSEPRRPVPGAWNSSPDDSGAYDQSPDGPGAWNQALMELGATICAPREPRCLACPLRELCAAFEQGIAGELPRRGKKPESVAVELEVLVVVDRGRLLIQRRPPVGRMADMWEFPTREVAPDGGTGVGLFPSAFADPVAGRVLAPRERLARITHGITHHRIRATVFAAELEGERGDLELRPGFEWVGVDEVALRGLTGMAKKLLRDRAVRSHVEPPTAARS